MQVIWTKKYSPSIGFQIDNCSIEIMVWRYNYTIVYNADRFYRIGKGATR